MFLFSTRISSQCRGKAFRFQRRNFFRWKKISPFELSLKRLSLYFPPRVRKISTKIEDSAINWTIKDVSQWFESLTAFVPSLKPHLSAFKENQIDGPKLLKLKEEDLKNMGITKKLHLETILAQISELSPEQSGIDLDLAPPTSIFSPHPNSLFTPNAPQTQPQPQPKPKPTKQINFDQLLQEIDNAQHSSQIYRVLNCYRDWWDQPKFRKGTGWDSPPFDFGDVQGILYDAADIVTFVREYLDANDNTMKFRMLDGNAQALFNRTSKIENENSFLRDLVHSTLSDAVGYVEGLSAQQIDDFMNKVLEFRNTQRADTHNK